MGYFVNNHFIEQDLTFRTSPASKITKKMVKGLLSYIFEGSVSTKEEIKDIINELISDLKDLSDLETRVSMLEATGGSDVSVEGEVLIFGLKK